MLVNAVRPRPDPAHKCGAAVWHSQQQEFTVIINTTWFCETTLHVQQTEVIF